MQVNYLVIGQGISGTFLSWELQQANQSFIVIDESNPYTASKVASGIINPVTGRRIVKTWMIDELMPFAWKAYQSIGEALQVNCIAEKNIIDCFATPQMRLAFTERFENDQQFLSLPANENDWLEYIQYDFGYGIIHPCYLVDLQLLLASHRKRLLQNNQLTEEHFDAAQLQIQENNIHYKGIVANKIIFCDGVAGFDNPFFKNLPYGASKGEIVLAEIPHLPATHIIKRGYSLVPWKENIFWLGSTYLWEFEDTNPTKGFYQFAENWLKQTVKMPFKIIDHMAAVRPATLERRPFVGLHPLYNNIGILNGMGTKGCSLAPYFANQLVNHLVNGSSINPDVDVQRFKKVLSR
jgi:glycine/D-amino acid oxidase-like deaminating enzyme